MYVLEYLNTKVRGYTNAGLSLWEYIFKFPSEAIDGKFILKFLLDAIYYCNNKTNCF